MSLKKIEKELSEMPEKVWIVITKNRILAFSPTQEEALAHAKLSGVNPRIG